MRAIRGKRTNDLIQIFRLDSFALIFILSSKKNKVLNAMLTFKKNTFWI